MHISISVFLFRFNPTQIYRKKSIPTTVSVQNFLAPSYEHYMQNPEFFWQTKTYKYATKFDTEETTTIHKIITN
jgi:hypothetical protein